jgi:hypothetical protein
VSTHRENRTEPARRAREAVAAWAAEAGLDLEAGARPGEVVVALPGEHKLRTTLSLLVGDHSLSASAFVLRRPDEAEARVHRWLLRRNARLPGLAFALDAQGDVYLVGRLPLAAVTPATVDDLAGAVLAAADGSFDELLALGFGSAIRREWAWRRSRGEPTANLEPFRRLLEEGPDQPGGGEAT